MRVLAATLCLLIAPTAWSDSHGVLPPTGDPYTQYQQDKWVDPALASYSIECVSTRYNQDESGNWVGTVVHGAPHAWTDLDYASWLVAERGLTGVQSAIIEAWGSHAAGASAGVGAFLRSTEYWGGP